MYCFICTLQCRCTFVVILLGTQIIFGNKRRLRRKGLCVRAHGDLQLVILMRGYTIRCLCRNLRFARV